MKNCTMIENGFSFATCSKSVVVTNHAIERFRDRFAWRYFAQKWRGYQSREVCAAKMFDWFVESKELPEGLRRVWMPHHDTPCRMALPGKKSPVAFVYRDDPDQRVVLTCFVPLCRNCREVWCRHVQNGGNNAGVPR